MINPFYNAAERAGIELLVTKMLSVPTEELITAIYELGLMRFEGFRLYVILTFVGLVRPRTGVADFFRHLSTTDPKTMGDLREQAIRHCRYGHDTEDHHSKGGWSQREINLLCDRMGWRRA